MRRSLQGIPHTLPFAAMSAAFAGDVKGNAGGRQTVIIAANGHRRARDARQPFEKETGIQV